MTERDNSLMENKVFYAKIDEYEQLDPILDSKYINNIIIPIHLLGEKDITDLKKRIDNDKINIFIALPNIIRMDYRELIVNKIREFESEVHGFLASSYDGLGLLKNLNISSSKIMCDFNIYSYNDFSVEALKSIGINKLTIPLELKKQEIFHRDNTDSVMVIYGHAPFMITAQCINKNNSNCNHKQADIKLIDRLGKKVFVKNYCNACYNIIYNPLATDLLTEIDGLLNSGINEFRLDFTVESKNEVRETIIRLEKALTGEKVPFEPQKMTRGHYNSGVE